MFLIAIGLILAWKIAGLIGLDFFLLPIFGTPWKRGHHDETPDEAGAVLREHWVG